MLHIEPKRTNARTNTRFDANAGPARMRGATSSADFSAMISERRPIRTAATRLAAPIEGLLALQCGEETISPAVRRRAGKGMNLLDTLEDLRLDTLSGRSGTETLEALAGQLELLGPASHNRGLESVMQALELRVRVELAKREVADSAQTIENADG